MKHAPIDFYFTQAAKEHLFKIREKCGHSRWHDQDVAWLCQMAVRYRLRYDLMPSDSVSLPPSQAPR
jgi:hypothetical protein